MKSTHKLLQEQERRFADVMQQHRIMMQVVDGHAATAINALKIHITWSKLSNTESEEVDIAFDRLKTMVEKLEELRADEK